MHAPAPPAPPTDLPSPDHRLWLQVFGACFGLVLVLLLWTILAPPFRGDLTRLGRLSETAFGPTRPAATLDPALRRSSALGEADVLVIGDSFSAPLQWQSALVAQGRKVATVHWDALGPICADLESMLQSQGFRGTSVVIESVERALDHHLDQSLACARHTAKALQTRHAADDPEVAGAFGLNTRETLFTGLLTTLHTWQALRTDAPSVVLDHDEGTRQVRIQHLPNGCQRFSHRACDRGLFYAEDETAPPFSPAMVERMKRLAARHPGLSITWLVIPNKSSVYLQPDRTALAGAVLETSGLGPDLFSRLTRRSQQTLDLYSPNDTHTSVEGHQVIGLTMLAWWKESRR